MTHTYGVPWPDLRTFIERMQQWAAVEDPFELLDRMGSAQADYRRRGIDLSNEGQLFSLIGTYAVLWDFMSGQMLDQPAFDMDTGMRRDFHAAIDEMFAGPMAALYMSLDEDLRLGTREASEMTVDHSVIFAFGWDEYAADIRLALEELLAEPHQIPGLLGILAGLAGEATSLDELPPEMVTIRYTAAWTIQHVVSILTGSVEQSEALAGSPHQANVWFLIDFALKAHLYMAIHSLPVEFRDEHQFRV